MFLKAIIALSMSIWVSSPVFAKAPANPTFGWQDTYSSQPKTERQHSRHGRPSRPHLVVGKRREGPPPPSQAQLLREDIAALRRELAGVRDEVERVRGNNIPLEQHSMLFPGIFTVMQPSESLASLPNLQVPTQPPVYQEPLPEALSNRLKGIEPFDEVKVARAYLVRTATVGYTMARQGPDIAIGRLHPDFAIKLQDAIRRARDAGLSHAGIFSAYRPPAFGVGGFSNKFNSLHSYGLAVDVTGIGGPGSAMAHLWQNIVNSVGLFLPYGPNNPAEYNHTQLISTKVAVQRLQSTITSFAPKDNIKMWLASGITAHVKEPDPVSVATIDRLPAVNWGHQ